MKQSNGRWTKTQHDRFMKGLQRYGKDWVCVQKVVKSRTLAQVRSHAQKIFLKMQENDIDALIGKEEEFKQPKTQQKNIKQDHQKKQNCNSFQPQVQETRMTKTSKKQFNLLEMFMQAIQLQSKQPFPLNLQKQTPEKLFSQQIQQKSNSIDQMAAGIQNIDELQQYPQEKSAFLYSPNQILYSIFPICFNFSNIKEML